MEKIDTLNNFFEVFKIKAKCLNFKRSGNLNIYTIQVFPGTKISKIEGLTKELMLFLRSAFVPKIKFNPLEGLLELEMIENIPASTSLIKELLIENLNSDDILPVSLGHSYDDRQINFDISKNPHMLIGGTTGSGKSSLINTIIANLLQRKSKIHIIDRKGEYDPFLSISNNISIVSNFSDIINLFKYLIFIMEKRYIYLKSEQVTFALSNLVPITLIIDEFADIILQDKNHIVYNLLCQLVQKCRAAGIYCILATQRPSFQIIDGAIKANFPARIACRTASKIDSRIILDNKGAEELSGYGDMIINNYKFSNLRFKASYSPIEKIVEFFNEKISSNV